MIYILFSSLIFLLFFFSLRSNNSTGTKSFLFMLSCFFMIIFIGFRFETGGPDWISYESFFIPLEPLSDVVLFPGKEYFFYDHGFELFYKILASLVKVFSDNYIFLNLICFYISFSIVASFIYRVSPYPILSVFLYFCTVSLLGDMTIVRQMLSVSVFIYSLKYVVNRSFFKYFSCCLIAFLFHYSAVIIIPFYWLYRYLHRVRFFVPAVIFTIALSLFSTTFLEYLLNFVLVNLKLGFAITFKLKQYLLEIGESSDRFGVGTLERLFLFVLLIKYRDKIVSLSPEYGRLIISLSVVNILLSFLFLNFTVFYLRFRYFFIFSNSILYVYIVFLFRQKAAGVLALYFYGIAWVLLVVLSNKSLYLPYQNYISFIFTDEKVNRIEMINRSFD